VRSSYSEEDIHKRCLRWSRSCLMALTFSRNDSSLR